MLTISLEEQTTQYNAEEKKININRIKLKKTKSDYHQLINQNKEIAVHQLNEYREIMSSQILKITLENIRPKSKTIKYNAT